MTLPPLVVIKPGALGDTLLLAPALRALRTAHPGHPVTVVGTMPQVALLPLLGVADRALSFERFALYNPQGRGAGILAGAAVLAFLRCAAGTSDPLRARGALISLWRPSRPQAGQGHVATHLHACLSELFPAIPPLHRAPFVLPAGPRSAVPVERPYAILAPGAGSPDKRLPLTRFLTLADELSARGVAPLLVAGETELENGLVRHLPPQYACMHSPPLEVLARLLGEATAVFANDSGPAHLSGLLGVDTTVFFGPTDPDTWRPWGPKITVLPF